MFESSENFSDINLIMKNNKLIQNKKINEETIKFGGNSENNIDVIKGGFPRIKICDNEIAKKILEKKPREFNNKKIMSIKDMLNIKKSDSIIDLITEPNIFINKQIGINDNSMLNIIHDESEKKINNISIDLIIGKSMSKKNKKLKKNKI
jgi:hypothetical protein